MKKRKLILAALAVVLCMPLAGCKNENTVRETETAGNITEINRTEEESEGQPDTQGEGLPTEAEEIMSTSEGTEESGEDAVPRGTGTLTVCVFDDIGDLNPHTANGLSYAQEWVYENLVALENGAVVPELAESWEISEDGLVYTFHLRDGVTFSDGSSFTAQIAKKNLDAVLLHREYYPYLPSFSAIEAVEAPDALTLVFSLSRPANSLLNDLAGYYPAAMLGEAGFPETGDTYYSPVKEPVGTGMWVLLEKKEGEYALFERNEDYWGEKPYFQFLKAVVYEDADEAAKALENGEIDLIVDTERISPEIYEQFKEAGFGTDMAETASVLNLSLNTAGPVTGDVNVRLALEYATDKEALAGEIFGGLFKTADFYFTKDIPHTDIGIEPYSYDLEKANRILEEAGWEYPEGESVRVKGEQRLEVDLLYDASVKTDEAAGELLKEQYAAAGIQLNLIPQDKDTYNQSWRSGEFGAVLSRTWGNPYEPYGTFACMVDPNDKFSVVQKGMSNKAELNVILYDSLSQNEESRLQEDFDYIMDSFHNEAVYIPLTGINTIALYNKEYSGPDLNSARGGMGIESMAPEEGN